MEQLFSNFPAISLDENFNPIILDETEFHSLRDEMNKKRIDISKASIEELSSMVVSEMINSVRKDLKSFRNDT